MDPYANAKRLGILTNISMVRVHRRVTDGRRPGAILEALNPATEPAPVI